MRSEDHLDGDVDESGQVVWLFDPAGDEIEAGDVRPVSPVELFVKLQTLLVHAGLHEAIAVTGTVAGLRRRGWCSFELVEQPPEASAPHALMRVVLLARALRSIDAGLRRDGTRLQDGATATVSGSLQWEPGWGQLRLVGQEVTIREQQSGMARRRDDLVASLIESGRLVAQRRLVVAEQPTRIGLVVGAGTAAAADIDTMLRGSEVPWRVLRRSVPMAGPAAATSIAAAVAELAAEGPELIVVARGGGGQAELGCWDSMAVAHAIAECPVPVWTAIGHASDSTVADLVANRAWATPSAAANALLERVQAAERVAAAEATRQTHAAEVEKHRAAERRALVLASVAVLLAVVILLAVWLG